MLFNSLEFILCFLPVTLAGFHLLSRFGSRAVVIWLGLASLVFYGYTVPKFLLVLIPSVLVNYLCSTLISRTIPNRISTECGCSVPLPRISVHFAGSNTGRDYQARARDQKPPHPPSPVRLLQL